jgi:hypothetical protein
MTLPRLIECALQKLHADPSLRYVFPLGGWGIETSTDRNAVILNLQTPDGFAVSFGVPRTLLRELADGLGDVADSHPPLRQHH